MLEDDNKKSQDIGEKYILLVCIDYFNSSIKISTSGASSNVRERNQ